MLPTVQISFLAYTFFFSQTGFLCVALEPVLELALVEQAGLKLTEIRLPLPLKCWDLRRAPPPPSLLVRFYLLVV